MVPRAGKQAGTQAPAAEATGQEVGQSQELEESPSDSC